MIAYELCQISGQSKSTERVSDGWLPWATTVKGGVLPLCFL